MHVYFWPRRFSHFVRKAIIIKTAMIYMVLLVYVNLLSQLCRLPEFPLIIKKSILVCIKRMALYKVKTITKLIIEVFYVYFWPSRFCHISRRLTINERKNQNAWLFLVTKMHGCKWFHHYKLKIVAVKVFVHDSLKEDFIIKKFLVAAALELDMYSRCCSTPSIHLSLPFIE